MNRGVSLEGRGRLGGGGEEGEGGQRSTTPYKGELTFLLLRMFRQTCGISISLPFKLNLGCLLAVASILIVHLVSHYTHFLLSKSLVLSIPYSKILVDIFFFLKKIDVPSLRSNNPNSLNWASRNKRNGLAPRKYENVVFFQ
jgi:hypothetical protein